MQSILDKWITINDIQINQTEFPPIFYLEWYNNRNRPYKDSQAKFISKLPEHTFYKKVKWDNHYIFTVGKFSTFEPHIFHNFTFINVPVLKSNLQKCIRRRLTIEALRTAYCLMANDFQSFIRRLPILMIEDVILNKCFSTLIWMMIAYPKWKPATCHVEWLLGVVHFLTTCNKADIPCKSKIISNNTNYLDSIYSLQIRKSFGGLSGDITMINKYIITWNNRFIKNNIPIEFFQKIKIINLESLHEFNKNDIQISAIDFHCYKIMITWIYDKFPNYEEEDIKKAIWFGSSGFNIRHKKNILYTCDSFYKQIWNEIKYEVIKTAKYLIYKLEE